MPQQLAYFARYIPAYLTPDSTSITYLTTSQNCWSILATLPQPLKARVVILTLS